MTQEVFEKATQLQKDIDRAYELKWLFDDMDYGDDDNHPSSIRSIMPYISSVLPSGKTINTAFPDYKLCRCVSEAIEKYIRKKEEEFENLK